MRKYLENVKVIVVASRKGGVGKSTITAHLAVQAGNKVAVLDMDSQGSLADWWNEREDGNPSFVRSTISELSGNLEALRSAGFRFVFVDTPPAITDSLGEIVSLADLVLVPLRPSPHDLRAVGGTIDLLEPSGTPFVFIVNGANKRARLTGEAAIALSQHGKVAPSILGQRQDFAASMIDGRTVGEITPGGPSAEEVSDLWSYVIKQIRK